MHLLFRAAGRHSRLGAGLLGLVVLTTTLVACGSGGGKKKASPPKPAANAGVYVRMTVSPQEGVNLTLIGQSEGDNSGPCGPVLTPPQHIAAFQSGSWCVHPNSILHPDAFSDFSYAIDGSQYLLWGQSKVPLAGQNTVFCQIRRQGTTNEDPTAPYGCKAEFTKPGFDDRFDPNPKITIYSKPSVDVTDDKQAYDMLEANCGRDRPNCTWTASKQEIIAGPRSSWVLYGAPYTNCTDKTQDLPYTFSKGTSVAWSSSFQIRAGTKFDIGPVEASIQGTYSKSSTESFTFNQQYTMYVHYGNTDGFFIVPGVFAVTGDFTIVTDKVYKIKNKTFYIPFSVESITPEGQSVPIPQGNVVTLHLKENGPCPPVGTPQLGPGSSPPPDAVVAGPAQKGPPK